MKGYARQITIVVLTALMLYACLSGGSGGFFDDGASSSVYFRYPTSFSPAPFAFAIWLPIFLGAIGLAVYQALPSQRGRTALDRMATPYGAALIANSLTPFAGLGVSNIVVVVLFVALCAAYAAFARPGDDAASRLLVRMPLAMFASWAGLASIVNGCQLLVSSGISIGGVTAAILYCSAAFVCCWAVLRTGEVVIAAVLIWAGVGIAAAQTGAGPLLAVIAVVSICTGAVAWRHGHWTARPRLREP